MVVLCQLKDMGLSCFGCCGDNYKTKKIIENISKNTLELTKTESISSFMSRTNRVKSSGICANLVYKDGIFFCPGHPALHGGRDYRSLDPKCDKEYICKTFGLFQQWNKEKRQKFLDFIEEKKLDSFTYSIKMDNGSLLKEFEMIEKKDSGG